MAAQIGTMSLALRRVGQADITPVRTVEIGDLRSTAPSAPGRSFPDDMRIGRMHAPTAPTAPSARPHGGTIIVTRTHSITVVHGDTSTQVDVPAERYGGGRVSRAPVPPRREATK